MILNSKPFPTFIKFAVPNILGMLALSSAQLIDAFFIGNYIGGTELASINIVFPVFSFLFGVSVMLSAGGGVMCAKYIGEKKLGKASEIFTGTLASVLVFVLASTLIFTLFPLAVVRLLGADETMEGYSATYLYYTSFFLVFFIASHTLGTFSKIEERPVFVFNVMLAGAAMNIFLDWLFIVKLKYGIVGAAIGTGLSEMMMSLMLLPYFFTPACRLKFVRLTRKIFKKIAKACYNGFSELVNEFSVGVTSVIFNWMMVINIGVAGVAAYTVINYVFWFGVIFSYSLGETLTPLVSMNYGARKHQRIKQFLRIALVTGETISIALFSVLLFRPGLAVGLFLQPEETEAISISMQFLHVAKWAFFFNGFNIILSSFFTSMHRPVESAVIAALRSFILPVLFLFLLPLFMGENGLYASIPASEAITFITGIWLFVRLRRRIKAERLKKAAAVPLPVNEKGPPAA